MTKKPTRKREFRRATITKSPSKELSKLVDNLGNSRRKLKAKKKATPKKKPEVDFTKDLYFLNELKNLRTEFRKREVARIERYKQEIQVLRGKVDYYERINRNLNNKLTVARNAISQSVNEYLT